LGLNYVNKFGPVDVAVSGGYMHANVESSASGAQLGFKDQQAWNLGFNLGYAGFLAVGAYTAGFLMSKWGWSVLAALPAAGVVSGLVSLLVGIP
ncbi:hypothetical protein ACE4Z5_25110, partial [Salmonella enterica]|uniref:ABC transporter permease subunit n=1 Tax=Salmonella enterica TaxID=28901 RepID=UPI003D28659E